VPRPPRTFLVVLSVIAGLQGVVFLGYAVYDVVQAFRVGITGPAEVSNLPALLGLIALTAAFGAGMLWVAWGWWNSRSWARAPFIVAQLVLGFIGYEMTSSASDLVRFLGQGLVLLAVIAIVLCFMPSVRSALDVGD